MIATVSLNFAVDISPVFHVIPKGYDITTSQAVFELRDKNGTELYAESSAGITVETITLTAPLKYADGTEIAAGTEVAALRVAPDLTSLSLGDPAHVNPVQYRYGLRVDDAWAMQGWYTVWPDTGPAGCMGSPIAVCCGPVHVAVNVCGVTTGSTAAAGGWLELEFTAADIAAGLPLLIGSVPADTLVCIAVLRFATYFDQNVVLKVGQEGNQKEVFGNDPPDDEGYETRFYSKFSGDIFLYPEFLTAPAVGAGVVYLTRG